MKRFDEDQFKQSLHRAPWDIVFVFEDIDDVVYAWEDTFNNILDVHCPWREKRVKQATQPPWMTKSVIKSGHPEISPGGVQNEKIENPQTLPEYRSRWTISRKHTLSSNRFLFFANGSKIGLAALTSVLRGPHNALFERRLKINKTVNLTTEYLNEKNTYLRTVWSVICPILSRTKFLGDFCFSSIFHSFRRTKK